MPKTKRIVILPFSDLSLDKTYEHFSDGITEDLINALSKIDHLNVISRTSSFYYKNKSFSIQELAEQLQVTLALEGSIQIHQKLIKISMRLINALEDSLIWSESWEGHLDKIFDLQNRMSLIIADKLREHLGHFEIGDQLIETQTNNLDSYEHYLKGKYYSQKWNPTHVNLAIEHYKKSIQLDKNHSMSYIGLAECYTFLSGLGLYPIEDAWNKITQLTQSASQITPEAPEVYFSLANIHFWTKSDITNAFKSAFQAIELKPSFARAHQFLGLLFALILKKERAIEQVQIAYKLDPMSYEIYFSVGYIYYIFEEYELALQWLKRTLIHNPNNTLAHTITCCCYLKLGRFDTVCSYFEQIPKTSIVKEDHYGLTAIAFFYKNEKSMFEIYKTKLIDLLNTDQSPRAYGYLFLVNTVEGNFDKAFEMLETKSGHIPPLLAVLFNDPLAHGIRKDPRYQLMQNKLLNIEIPIKVKDKKPLLDQVSTIHYCNKISSSMTEDKLYLNSELTLRNLANHINLHPNQLSWLINDQYNKNFKELINSYRVDYFKHLVELSTEKPLYIIGLAYESGFNSKTAFNAFFKKYTGITPSQYVKQHH